jgi:hypothetical protein
LTALYTSLEVCTSDRNTPTTVEALTKGPEAAWKSWWRGIVVVVVVVGGIIVSPSMTHNARWWTTS